MPAQRIVVIGASAGGVKALSEIARGLPANFAAPVFVVIHVPPESRSILPEILSRRGHLRAKHAEDGERYKAGVIYVAPPDRHMMIHGDTISIERGPREKRHRPAIDPLFRSAATAHSAAVIGVILTGSLDDGTAGLLAIKQGGGIAIVQDPADAIHASMPQSAIENVDVDFTLPVRQISRKLVDLTTHEMPASPRRAARLEVMEMENRISEMEGKTLQDDDRPGQPSAFSCPDCGGVLWEIDDGNYVRFRCRVGPESMLGAQSDVLEEALFSALKTLEESARLSKRLADNERARKHEWLAMRFEARERDARERAEVIRRVLISGTSEVPEANEEELEHA